VAFAAMRAFQLLYKSWQGELKATGAANGGFAGYGSMFGILDDGGDVVDPGAFAGTLDQFVTNGFISDGHNWGSVSAGAIGTIVDAKEDDRGLWMQTEYHSTPTAQAARTIAQERLARGKSVGLSIGYAIEPGGAEFKDGARHILKVRLFEVSQVNVPMLRQAGLTGVKGFGIPFDEHSEQVRVALEEWLERVKSGSDVRLKEGRPISEGRRTKIAGVKDSLSMAIEEIQALLEETAPRVKEELAPPAEGEAPADATPKSVDPVLAELYAKFQAIAAQHPTLTT